MDMLGFGRMLPGRTGGERMRYKVGAEQLEQVPSLAHRPDGVFRSARTAPVGPTHAVDSTTGAVACGSQVHRRDVLDHDWEAAFFAEKCPWLFRRRRRPRQGVTSSSAGERPRRADLPTQRHPGSEPDALQPHLIHPPAQQPQAANARRVRVGIGWAGPVGRDRGQAPTPGSRR